MYSEHSLAAIVMLVTIRQFPIVLDQTKGWRNSVETCHIL